MHKKGPTSESAESRERSLVEKAAHEAFVSGMGLNAAEQLFREKFFEIALEETDFNICRTAQTIDIHRNTLTRSLGELKLKIIGHGQGKCLRKVAA